jgi:arginyl-tRNA synthetase
METSVKQAKVNAVKIVAGQPMVLIDYPSLKQRLANLLMDAALSIPVSLQSIPLQTEAKAPVGTFISPVALQLAGRRSAMDVAQFLLSTVPATQGLKLWVEAPGWIYGQFCEEAKAVSAAPPLETDRSATLATWLQQLTQQNPHLQFPDPLLERTLLDDSLSDPHLFPVQYAHARCCSLLHLAQRERFIDLQPRAQELNAILTPTPWYTEQKQLRLQHPAEQTLIRQLLEFPGALQTPKQAWRSEQSFEVPLPWPLDRQRLVRYTQSWGEDFMRFYRDCRIFGEVSQQNLPLSQARLGLVLATQRVLAFLLQDLLRLVAPKEL